MAGMSVLALLVACQLAAPEPVVTSPAAGFRAERVDLRQSLPAPAGPVDHELASVAARNVEGVRGVVWFDRDHLLAIVGKNEQRSQRTIEDICRRLQPLGDASAVVVDLQSSGARTAEQLQILSRNCPRDAGELALNDSR